MDTAVAPNDRLRRVIDPLNAAGYDVFSADQAPDLLYIIRDGWVGVVYTSNLPSRHDRYTVSFALKPSREHGTGHPVATPTDVGGVVDAAARACAPTCVSRWNRPGTVLHNRTAEHLFQHSRDLTRLTGAGRRSLPRPRKWPGSGSLRWST